MVRKIFKCPKCGRLLQLEITLPENVKSWPFIMKYKHNSPNGECEIALAIDSNYTIREIGKEGMDETKKIAPEETEEEKKVEDLDFKVLKEE